jgi:2-dehydro-3-deoxygluconokinase
MARIVCIGEGMLELRRDAGGDWEVGSAGDTLNTAIHLSRSGHDVAYLTAVGNDPLSKEIKDKWRAEGLDTALVLTHPTHHAGLYAINTDESGERSFTYWRESSAAREMFTLPGMAEALEQAEGSDLVYFSLITLAILPEKDRFKLMDSARRARSRGAKIAFDGNYRPRLWVTQHEASQALDRAIALADIGLPTLDDETALNGENDANAVAARWQALGCVETLVKLGSAGCRLPDGRIVATETVLHPIDTSGAGDAFNAGYLNARLRGVAIGEAALAGHVLAGWTIMRPGAIPARDP